MNKEKWLAEVGRLELFFKTTPILIKEHLTSYSKVDNIGKMIDAHIAVAKFNAGNQNFIGFVQRLQEFEEIIKHQTSN